MEYSQIAIALLLVGLTIIFTEIFVPSGGMLALVSIATILASLVSAWYAWGETSPTIFWVFLAITFVAAPSAAGCALWIFPSTPLGKAALLEPPKLDDLEGHSEHERKLRELIGRTGTTVGLLTPGGVVLVNGERMHCESEGMLIEAGTTVDVIDVRGNRLVVRIRTEAPADAEHFGERSTVESTIVESDLAADSSSDTVPDEAEPPLDFPISQG